MMAVDALVGDGELLARQLQAAEVDRLIEESADLELAFQMQLAEALRASAESMDTDSDESDESDAPDGVDAVSGDRQFAIMEQRQEQTKLNQEMEDEAEARREQSRLAEIDEVSRHDARFARLLSAVPDREWLERGEHVSDPYVCGHNRDKGKGVENQARHVPWGSASSSSLLCQGSMWEPAVAAAFLLDDSYKKSYLASSKEYFHDEGECSKASVCGICFDTPVAPHNAMMTSDDCMHRFCTDCLRKHGEAVVNSGKAHIRCPAVGCEQVWSTKMSENLLSSGILLRLVQRQIEQTFPETERVYCPFQDCSAMLLTPELQTQPSSSSHPHQTAVGGVECIACNRLFCLECRVPWHGELSCEEFQALPKDERSAGDIGLADLAKRKRWQRCQECGSMVELLSGCHHITCRCGNDFCYTCGKTWSDAHLCQD